jgi:hypothetical protein
VSAPLEFGCGAAEDAVEQQVKVGMVMIAHLSGLHLIRIKGNGRMEKQF